MDVKAIRQKFPALASKQIFLDNAGGSQVLQEVIDWITYYLTFCNAQIGASYPISVTATKLIDEGWAAAARYINAGRDEVALGASSTQLFRNLASALYNHINEGDEIIVSKIDHEANIAPWVQLAEDRGAVLKWIEPLDKTNPQISCDDLRVLMTDRTKLVAITQTSNILGTINDVKALAKVVHEKPHALISVDGVAFAPHRAVDVKEWDVDFYSFSWYKLYGPHVATIYASKKAQKSLRIIGHPYKEADSLENILGLAAASYELISSIPKACEYLANTSWELIAKHEENLQAILIDYLKLKGDLVQIWGEPVADRNRRVPVISFTVRGRSSKEIVENIQSKSNIGIKWGSFLSIRLCEDVLGLDLDDGVIRVSMVHYNTDDEIRELVQVLDSVI